MIKVILWDIDGTLLNFDKAMCYALRKCFALFQLGECTDEMVETYSAINHVYWERLERNEITKQQVLVGRFEEFFQKQGILVDLAVPFNQEYQKQLGDHVFFNDEGGELVRRLQTKVKQYAVTNGPLTTQQRKLAKSGLDQLLDGIFISDEIGAEKPNSTFFDVVLKAIAKGSDYQKDEILIVGDSLTSDIQGGNNAKICCCWYNPYQNPNQSTLRIDYEIQDLRELEGIVS